MSDTLIKVEGVSKRFCRSLKLSLWYGMQDLGSELLGRRHGGEGKLRQDEFWALRDVNFELRRGECLGLIGHNGAGKTTLLRLLNGLIRPDSGRIEVRGRVGALIGLGAGFNPILTGRENILVNASVLGLRKHEIDAKIDEIIDFSELDAFIDAPVQNYSSGMQVRLGFAVATILEPDILLLDEILAVGDAAFRTKCFNRILELMRKCAVVFVSHSMAQIGRVATSVAHLEQGRLCLFADSPSAGIAAYNRQNQGHLDKCNVESETLAIEHMEVSEHSSDSEQISAKSSSGKIDICVRFRVKKATDQSISMLIVIMDTELINVAEIRRPLDTSRPMGHEIYEQCITLDKQQLNTGTYHVSCALLVGDAGQLGANCQFGASMVVDSGWAGYAPIRL